MKVPQSDSEWHPNRTQLTRGAFQRVGSWAAAWLQSSVPGHGVVVFRVCFGLLMAIWCFDYLRTDRVSFLCRPDQFHFTYPGLGFIRPWPGPGMVLEFAVMLMAALLIAAGAMLRAASIVFALGFTHFFLIDRTNYQNHYYLVLLVSWVMVLVPANRMLSVDRLSQAVTLCATVPRWSLCLLQFHIALPYLFGGVAKLDADWLSGEPVRQMLMTQDWSGNVERVLPMRVLSGLITWGGLIFDLLIVPALMHRRTRIPAYVLALCFHLTNSMLFRIHIFPWLMMAAPTLFFPADWPLRLFRRGVRPVPQSDPVADRQGRPEEISVVRMKSGHWLMIAYCLFHLVWPLRHLIYDGHTGWTERGHSFSWRMMLRGKTTGLRYLLVDKARNEIWNVDVRQFPNHEQELKSSRNPFMIADFARHVADTYAERTGRIVAVHAVVLASLNGRKPQLLVDPAVNLAEVRSLSWHQPWIMPLTEPLRADPWTVPLDEWDRYVELPSLSFLLPTASVGSRCEGSSAAVVLNRSECGAQDEFVVH